MRAMLSRMSVPLAAAGVAVALAGCGTIDHQLYSTPAPVPVIPPPERPLPGAIGAPGQQLALFEDTKAHNVGDLITIVLNEATQGSKKADTDGAKADSVSLTNMTVFGKTLHTNSGLTNSQSFSGKGDSDQSNSLTGSVTVAVTQVLANGTLYVRGEKQLELNQGMEYLRIEGIIRPQDIGSDNSVTSDRVADARISYVGKGQLNDTNEEGWLTRLLGSGWMPF